jgi:hypothetical protein
MVNALPPVVAGSEPCSVEVVPLAGDPPKLSKHPATSVARGLSTKLTGSYATVPSLEGVPHAPKERTNLENRFPEWGALFYPDGSCRRPLDMVLTSAGCFTKWRVWGSGFGGVNLDAETLQKKAGVVGDIGLTLVPGALQSRDQERRYKDYSGHGTSLSLGALGDLAQRAARDSSIVGVCLVVLGGNKLVVTEALLSRCVNVLVIDSEMALALKRGFKC